MRKDSVGRADTSAWSQVHKVQEIEERVLCATSVDTGIDVEFSLVREGFSMARTSVQLDSSGISGCPLAFLIVWN